VSEELRARAALRPACLTEAEWREWQRAAKAAMPSVLDGVCADCTPEFKAAMLRAGRCEWLCVEFITDEEGGVTGRRMSLNRGVRNRRQP